MNLELSNKNLKRLLNDYDLNNLVCNNTCFKSSKGTCIDLILTNKKMSFQHTNSFETGLSDCHHLIYSMFKMSYLKQKPVKYTYRKYKDYNLDSFKCDLRHNLNKYNTASDFSTFSSIFSEILNLHAPLKQKMIRGNHKPFISKSLRKEMMKRAHLKIYPIKRI